MRSILSLAVVPLLIPLQYTSAQQGPPIETGSRIRVTAPALGVDKLVGTSVEVDATRIRVQADDQAAAMTISLTEVTRLEVSQGRKSNALAGLGIGFLGGAAIGGLVAMQFDEEGGDSSQGQYFLFGAVVGGAAFGAIGAGIGALVKTERWEEVPLDRLRVSIVPLRDGRLALGLSVAF